MAKITGMWIDDCPTGIIKSDIHYDIGSTDYSVIEERVMSYKNNQFILDDWPYIDTFSLFSHGYVDNRKTIYTKTKGEVIKRNKVLKKRAINKANRTKARRVK